MTDFLGILWVREDVKILPPVRSLVFSLVSLQNNGVKQMVSS